MPDKNELNKLMKDGWSYPTGGTAISPTVVPNANNTEDDYRLDVIGVNGVTTTPNLLGEDGKTPERGVDYWTEEDVAAITEDVEEIVGEAITEAIGASY